MEERIASHERSTPPCRRLAAMAPVRSNTVTTIACPRRCEATVNAVNQNEQMREDDRA